MTTRPGSSVAGRSGVGDGELEELGWFGQVERGEDGLVTRCAGGTLRDVAVAGGQGDQVHAVEFVAQVAPGVAGSVLGDTDEKQCKPA